LTYLNALGLCALIIKIAGVVVGVEYGLLHESVDVCLDNFVVEIYLLFYEKAMLGGKWLAEPGILFLLLHLL